MKLIVDHQADALYLTISENPAARSEEVSPGIILDFDEAGHPVGIEMLYLSKRASESEIHRMLFESVPLAG